MSEWINAEIESTDEVCEMTFPQKQILMTMNKKLRMLVLHCSLKGGSNYHIDNSLGKTVAKHEDA